MLLFLSLINVATAVLSTGDRAVLSALLQPALIAEMNEDFSSPLFGRPVNSLSYRQLMTVAELRMMSNNDIRTDVVPFLRQVLEQFNVEHGTNLDSVGILLLRLMQAAEQADAIVGADEMAMFHGKRAF